MDTVMLGTITSRWDISGVFCLAAIPCLIFVLLFYSKGLIAGASTCCVIWAIFVFSTGDSQSSGDWGYTTESGFITNRSQTKWIKKDHYSINEENCVFLILGHSTSSSLDNYCLFIPAEEIMMVNGRKRMKPDGRDISEDDYYNYDEVVNKTNVPEGAGGWGVPQWVYHPAAPCYIFGLAGFPALLGGMFIASKL